MLNHKFNLAEVKKFNAIGYGIPKSTTTGLLLQLEMLESEVDELIESLTKVPVDWHQARDDIADILYVAYGMYVRLGVADPEFGTTDASNALPVSMQTAEWLKCSLVGIKYYVRYTDAEVLPTDDHLLGSLKLFIEVIELAIKVTPGFELAQEDFEAVQLANMSKFDLTEELSIVTAEKYAAIEVEIKTRTNEYEGTKYYIPTSAIAQTGTDGKDYPKGKILKSINTKEPVFKEL